MPYSTEMATTNATGDEDQKTYEELFCSGELTKETHNHLIGLSGINIFLSITALLGNILILVAFHRESSLHPPTKLLFRSLAITDLCVAIMVDPLAVAYWLSVIYERWDICLHVLAPSFVTSRILCSVSLLTLTAISVDRLFALLLGLRYRHIFTLKRTRIAVTAFWVVSLVGTTVYIWNNLISLWYGYACILVCLATSIFSYTKIFLRLRHHQTQVRDHVHQDQPSQATSLNIARYRKAVSSVLWLQMTLAVCYLPYVLVGTLFNNFQISSSLYLASEWSTVLVYLNSSLNPVLYCWKMREVRRAVKEAIIYIFCSSS